MPPTNGPNSQHEQFRQYCRTHGFPKWLNNCVAWLRWIERILGRQLEPTDVLDETAFQAVKDKIDGAGINKWETSNLNAMLKVYRGMVRRSQRK